MSENVVFGLASSRNITFNYTDEQDITKAEWAEMSESERDSILEEYLWENVEVWVEEE